MKKYTTLLALLFMGTAPAEIRLFVLSASENQMSPEAIRMAVSLDGYNYKALNGDRRVAVSRD